MTTNKVALNMIIGQRHEQYLEYALRSTEWLDEHVIVNTGDEDNPNMEVVKKIIPQAKILKYEGDFDFASARNFALDNTESPWILWQDADEVHFDRFKGLVREYAGHSYDGIRFGFFHFILDMYHFQSIDLRTNMFKKKGVRWEGSVHEQVVGLKDVHNNEYRYHHYGYTKPQSEIYENWKLYWSLNPGEEWKVKEKRNPDDIISDRVTVAHPYMGEYPEVIKAHVSKQKMKVDNYRFIEEQNE